MWRKFPGESVAHKARAKCPAQLDFGTERKNRGTDRAPSSHPRIVKILSSLPYYGTETFSNDRKRRATRSKFYKSKRDAPFAKDKSESCKRHEYFKRKTKTRNAYKKRNFDVTFSNGDYIPLKKSGKTRPRKTKFPPQPWP